MKNANRKIISDSIESMLKEEIVYMCPLGLSKKCEKFERIEEPFSNHHIDGDSSNSEYWNLIRVCNQCHEECEKRKNDGNLIRKIRSRKRDLFINYFGPLAINVLKLAYKYEITTAMPAMVLKLLDKGYLKVSQHNTMTVGASLKHVTFQEYEITSSGKLLVEKVLGVDNLPKDDFNVR